MLNKIEAPPAIMQPVVLTHNTAAVSTHKNERKKMYASRCIGGLGGEYQKHMGSEYSSLISCLYTYKLAKGRGRWLFRGMPNGFVYNSTRFFFVCYLRIHSYYDFWLSSMVLIVLVTRVITIMITS